MITFNKAARRHRPQGFTLVEVMITITLLALVLGSMIPTFTFFSKSTASLGNYTTMSMESRHGLELFSRDLHAVASLAKASKTEIEFDLPADAGGDTVNYKYDSVAKNLTRTLTDPDGNVTVEVLFGDVRDFEMIYFNRLDADVTNRASILTEAKSVQVKATLVKKVVTTENTDYIISARFLMRNM
jgi:prepilin-type N-terminal cleavage/methylation domain-containing protein